MKSIIRRGLSILIIVSLVLTITGCNFIEGNKSKPKDSQIKKDIETYYIKTSDNPLNDTYTDYTIEVQMTLTEEIAYKAVCLITIQDKCAHGEIEMEVYYIKYDQGWTYDRYEIKSKSSIPVAPLDEDSLYELFVSEDYSYEKSEFNMISAEWEKGSTTSRYIYETFRDNSVMVAWGKSMEIKFNSNKMRWDFSDSQKLIYKRYDLSFLNGTWTGSDNWYEIEAIITISGADGEIFYAVSDREFTPTKFNLYIKYEILNSNHNGSSSFQFNDTGRAAFYTHLFSHVKMYLDDDGTLTMSDEGLWTDNWDITLVKN